MASFTDAIPQFNPYIQQLPVEAMVKVGMEKQQRYDQGLQKIQSQIDQVAGLDIVRDVDRQYLQSKLNNLGSKLKTVAAGDFSNYQLVNSVAGMASNVAKDNNVLSSVQSTAQYRKEQKFMEESRQKGESAIQNEYDFNAQANRWINDSSVGAGFSGRYRKYTDVNKKWLEVMKTLHSDLLEEDIPYTYNEDGSINVGETAQAMQRISKEGVSAEKIQNALRSSLSPDELEQLNINGRYEFRNINDPAQLATLATSRTASSIAQNNKTIGELEGALKMYESDPDKYVKTEQGIKSLKESNARLAAQMNEEIEFIKSNPEQAKGIIYKNGAIEQFASSYAWENQKNNLLTNPIREDDWKAKNYSLSQAAYSLSAAKFDYEKLKDNRDYALKLEEANAKMYGTLGGFEVFGGLSTDVPPPRVSFLQDIDSTSAAVEDQVNSLVSELNSRGGTKVQKIQVLNALDAYLKGYTTGYDYLIPNDLKDLGNSIIDAKSDLNRKELAWKTIQEEAVERGKLEIEPITVETDSGNISFTPEEVVNYISKIKYKSEAVYVPQAGTVLQTGFAPEVPLTAKEKILHANRGLNITELKKAYDTVIDDTILDKAIQYVPREVPIIFGSGDGDYARRTWENISTSLLNKVTKSYLSGMEGGYPGLSSEQAANALSWFSDSDKGNLQYKKLEQGDKTSLIVMKGGESVVIPLDAREAQSLPLVDPNSPSPQLRKLMETQALGGRTTNANGSFENSYFKNQYMPNVKMNARADMTQVLGSPQKQLITFRLRIPNGTVYPLQYPEPVDATAGMNFIGNLTDEKVKQLYLQSSNISEEVKKIIRTM
jgi:hypothetical protein